MISKTTIVTASAVTALFLAGVISTSASAHTAPAAHVAVAQSSSTLKAEWQKGYDAGLVVGAKNGSAAQKQADNAAITAATNAGIAQGEAKQKSADTPKDATQAQADEAAKNYMSLGTGFSRSGMISQLEFQGFSASVSGAAASSVGLN